MAKVCRLANQSAGATYDFLTGALSIRYNTWKERPTRDGNIISTFELIAVDSDANIIAAAETSIGELIEVHELAKENDLYRETLWFEYNATSETAKRSLIHDIVFYQKPEGKAHPLLGETRAVYKMAITHGIWEDRSETAINYTHEHSPLGGNITIAAIKGSAPARMSYLQFQAQENAGGPTDRIWCGIRPTRHGITSFDPLWELEDGTSGTDASADNISGASPSTDANNCQTVTFGTNTMINRVSMTVDDACADANYGHFIGRYMVLLRYSMSSTATNVVAEMRSGYPSNTTFEPHGEHVLTGTTAWRLEPMGNIQIPSWAFRENTGNVNRVARDFTIQIHAIRTAGANLYLDALVLIPSEHFVSVEGADLEYDGGVPEIFINVTEYGEEVALFSDPSDQFKTNMVASFNNWRLPIEGGLLVIGAERTASSVHTDDLSIGAAYYPRHRNHREA